jgi:hypothetical protein
MRTQRGGTYAVKSKTPFDVRPTKSKHKQKVSYETYEYITKPVWALPAQGQPLCAPTHKGGWSLMANHLNIHLARNIARLKQTKFVCPETGKEQTFGAVSSSLWLQIIMVICNTAADQDRLYYAGWRYLTKEAGTNNTGATYWVQVFEQVGWITPNGTHAPDTGKRGKPSKCWLVTLPDLPPLLQQVWVAPEKAQPTAQRTQAPVVAITDRPQSKAKRTGAPVSLTAQVGNIVHELVPDSAHSLQPVLEPQYSAQTLQVLDTAEVCIRKQLASQQGVQPITELRTTLVVEQAKGSWHARYGNRTAPAKQVETALGQGICTETEAVQYLASGVCTKTDLVQFVGGTASN